MDLNTELGFTQQEIATIEEFVQERDSYAIRCFGKIENVHMLSFGSIYERIIRKNAFRYEKLAEELKGLDQERTIISLKDDKSLENAKKMTDIRKKMVGKAILQVVEEGRTGFLVTEAYRLMDLCLIPIIEDAGEIVAVSTCEILFTCSNTEFVERIKKCDFFADMYNLHYTFYPKITLSPYLHGTEVVCLPEECVMEIPAENIKFNAE